MARANSPLAMATFMKEDLKVNECLLWL
jgi:hypothetical protein